MTRAQTGAFLGRAGEWAHYVGASFLCFRVGGAPLVVAYFALGAVPILAFGGRGGSRRPSVRLERARSGEPPESNGGRGGSPRSSLWLLAPVSMGAMALLVQLGKPHILWIAALGLAALAGGMGGASAGRPPAWMAGLRGAPGVAGPVGALVAVVLVGRAGLPSVFILAALVLLTSGALGERQAHRGPVVPPLAPAAAAMGWVLGMQVIQFDLVQQPAVAGFLALAYSIGLHFGLRAAPTADVRAILAAPFAAAAALAALSVVQGPGLLILWASVAGALGLVLGSGSLRESAPAARGDWPLAAAGAGALWSLSAGTLGAEPVLWGGATVALAGGFLSMHWVRKLATTRPAVPVQPPVPVRIPVPVQLPVAGPSPTLVEAAQMLLDASRSARGIRSRALQLHREVHQADFVEVARIRAARVLDQLRQRATAVISKTATE